jgi:hypothetical protein
MLKTNLSATHQPVHLHLHLHLHLHTIRQLYLLRNTEMDEDSDFQDFSVIPPACCCLCGAEIRHMDDPPKWMSQFHTGEYNCPIESIKINT